MSVAARAARIVIADDQGLFRDGLSLLLDLDDRVEVVGRAADGDEAVRMVAELQPDVVLMDLKMPGSDGVEATGRIVREAPETRVIILTTFESDGYVLQALRAGASGYLLKDSTPEAIVLSIQAVMAGERVIAGSVATRVLGMLSGATSGKEFYDGLTPREVEVLRMIATGMANKEIAYRLQISDKTVRNHVSNMYEKLQVFDRAQATLYAVRKGLVDL